MPMPHNEWRALSCRIEEVDGGTLLRVAGEIDLASAQSFEQRVRKALALGLGHSGPAAGFLHGFHGNPCA